MMNEWERSRVKAYLNDKYRKIVMAVAYLVKLMVILFYLILMILIFPGSLLVYYQFQKDGLTFVHNSFAKILEKISDKSTGYFLNKYVITKSSIERYNIYKKGYHCTEDVDMEIHSEQTRSYSLIEIDSHSASKCVFCLKFINSLEKAYQFVCCDYLSHTAHVHVWIKENSKCPACNSGFDVKIEELT